MQSSVRFKANGQGNWVLALQASEKLLTGSSWAFALLQPRLSHCGLSAQVCTRQFESHPAISHNSLTE